MNIFAEKINNRPFILCALCIIFAYILPYHVHPFRAFYNDWLVILAIVILFVFQSERKAFEGKIPWLMTIPLVLAILIFFQMICGMLTVRWDVIFPIAYLIFSALAISLGATMAADQSRAYKLCEMLVVSHLVAGLISVSIATLQFIGAESDYGSLIMQFPHAARDFVIRPYANVAQPNQLALLFCISIAGTWWLFQVGKIKKVTGVIVVVILIWGLTLTQSRIGWLILPTFFIILWKWRRENDFCNVSPWVTAPCLFFYILLVWFLPNIAAIVGSSAYDPVSHVGTLAHSQRLVLLKQALQISWDHPLLGAGWYEFGPQQVTIGSNFPPTDYVQHSHNIVTNFAAEIGWPFTLLVFGVFSYWFYVGCLHRRISKEVGFSVLFLVAVALHSLVEFPLWYAYVLMPTSLLVGMIHQQQFGSKLIRVSRLHVVILSLVMLGGLVATAIDYRHLVLGFRALGWESLGLKPDKGTTKEPLFTIFPHFYDYFHFAKTRAHKGMSAVQIAEMEKVMKRFGYAPVLMRMSLVYALNNRPDDAFKAMMTINRLHSDLYPEAYTAWKNLTESDPASYAKIFSRLPLPKFDKK